MPITRRMCAPPSSKAGAVGHTTPTDPRSQRNRAGRGGGQLTTRALSSSYRSACPPCGRPLASYDPSMLLRAASYGFIRPCLPAPAERPPDSSDWVHEIKHDGYRLMVRRDGAGVQLLTRNGHDWSARFPLILEAAHELGVQSCLIDGEAVACDNNGFAVFERLRRKHEARAVFLYAFDLLELDGVDLRREPIEVRSPTATPRRNGTADHPHHDHPREGPLGRSNSEQLAKNELFFPSRL